MHFSVGLLMFFNLRAMLLWLQTVWEYK